jgi:hypothetical protein
MKYRSNDIAKTCLFLHELNVILMRYIVFSEMYGNRTNDLLLALMEYDEILKDDHLKSR